MEHDLLQKAYTLPMYIFLATHIEYIFSKFVSYQEKVVTVILR